ncbi:unnamed protein product [Calypogeia fissa]
MDYPVMLCVCSVAAPFVAIAREVWLNRRPWFTWCLVIAACVFAVMNEGGLILGWSGNQGGPLVVDKFALINWYPSSSFWRVLSIQRFRGCRVAFIIATVCKESCTTRGATTGSRQLLTSVLVCVGTVQMFNATLRTWECGSIFVDSMSGAYGTGGLP